LDEFMTARGLVSRCIEDLGREGATFNKSPKIGAMIELPSAIEISAELDREADFICAGTNDLTMYMLGVDRTNEQVSDLFVNYNPSVLRGVARLAANVADVPNRLSICGEAAGDPVMVPFFIGLGIRRLSVEPRNIPSLKADIAALTVRKAEQTCKEMLEHASVSAIERYIEGSDLGGGKGEGAPGGNGQLHE
ncbi:MAG: putative PEP-binding protein, partial [Spirochaetales bacterium]